MMVGSLTNIVIFPAKKLESVTYKFEKLILANVLKIVLDSHSIILWIFPPKILIAII